EDGDVHSFPTRRSSDLDGIHDKRRNELHAIAEDDASRARALRIPLLASDRPARRARPLRLRPLDRRIEVVDRGVPAITRQQSVRSEEHTSETPVPWPSR